MKQTVTTATDLVVGHIYRGKRPQGIHGWFNDRMIMWLGITQVQYDSPTVKTGERHPTVTIGKFLDWAASDVTEGYPKGTWADFERTSLRQIGGGT